MLNRSWWIFCLVLFFVGMSSGCGSGGSEVKNAEPAKMTFSHIGIITSEKKPGEVFVPATRVWVTDFLDHPYHVEWLRFEPDSSVSGPVREMPHVAYEVDSIDDSAKGMKELLAPFDAGIAVVGFYQTEDGAVVEFMEMKESEN